MNRLHKIIEDSKGCEILFSCMLIVAFWMVPAHSFASIDGDIVGIGHGSDIGANPIVGKDRTGLWPYNSVVAPGKYVDLLEGANGYNEAARTFFPSTSDDSGNWLRWYVNVKVQNSGTLTANFRIELVEETVGRIKLDDRKISITEYQDIEDLEPGEATIVTFQVDAYPDDNAKSIFRFWLYETDGINANEVSKQYDYEVCIDANAPSASTSSTKETYVYPDELPVSLNWVAYNGDVSGDTSAWAPIEVDLYRGQDANAGNTGTLLVSGSSQTTGHYFDESVASDHSYNYHVWAIDAVGHISEHVYTRGAPTISAPDTLSNIWITIITAISFPPSKATNPNPGNGATEQAINTTINWANGSDATSYDIYFGIDSSLNTGDFKGNQTSTSYQTETLDYNTTYYWRIDTKNSDGTTTGDLWRFTTIPLPPISQLERNALIALYNSTNGDYWRANTGWLGEPGTECSWLKVTCSLSGGNSVVKIDLARNHLTGSIPPDIGNFTNLTELNLRRNDLTGSIPPEIGNLANLTILELDFNDLTGSIPQAIGNLTNLKYLDLGANDLTGSIPPEIGNLANLNHLELKYNNLTGSIPPEIGNLRYLEGLELGGNQLSGSIPTSIGNLTNLDYLDLWNNSLTGSIPPEIGNLGYLEVLRLEYNQLTGSIPPEIGNLDNLKKLSLNRNGLTGSIPPEIGNLGSLDELNLERNHLSGSIPQEIGNLTILNYLDLGANDLTGSIPSEIGNLANLNHLELNYNNLTGSIPPEIGNLGYLEELLLDNNQLTGSIPLEIGNLDGLKKLSLTGNVLTGSIPPEIGNLDGLEILSLSGNGLTGSIPPEIGSLANLTQLYLRNNGLTGSIPPEIGNLDGLEILSLNSNGLTGSIPPEIGSLANLTHLSLKYNALFTNDDFLRTFINSKDSNWENYQTVAPEIVTANPVIPKSIKVSWIPIPDTIHPDGFLIYYSHTSGGPYTLIYTTKDKSESQKEIIDLTPNTRYYFVIQSRTDSNQYNQNTVYSGYSDEASATISLLIGDFNGNNSVDLEDAILSIQVLVGLKPSFSLYNEVDTNRDNKISIEDGIYILQKVSDVR